MKLFVQTPEFKAMNVGFGLDEGIAGPQEVMPLFYGERNVFWIKVRSNSFHSLQLSCPKGDLSWKSRTWLHVPGKHSWREGSIYDQQAACVQVKMHNMLESTEHIVTAQGAREGEVTGGPQQDAWRCHHGQSHHNQWRSPDQCCSRQVCWSNLRSDS